MKTELIVTIANIILVIREEVAKILEGSRK